MADLDRITFASIRHGTNDYRETVALRERILREPLGLAFSTDELAAEAISFHLTCRQRGQLAGCLVLEPAGDDRIQMRQVVVATSRQRQGIGTALVEYSETFAGQRGYQELFLHAREEAIPFYLRLGYHVEGELFIEVSIPHVSMHKSL